jgi:4'-phosphopantetheinyl transferase
VKARTVGVYWLEQIEADVPVGDQWLNAGEKSRVATLRFHKRRSDWRLGRWTAKRAVASCLNFGFDFDSLRDIEIRAALSGVPEVFLFNQRTTISLSLSHRAGRALCVIGFSGASLGGDLELVERRDRSFVTDFFTTNEQELVEQASAGDRALLVTLLWSAKESALKALRVGLRFDTVSVEVTPEYTTPCREEGSLQGIRVDWSRLFTRCIGNKILCGWWRNENDMVRTIVSDLAMTDLQAEQDSRWPCKISQAW